MLLQRCIDRNSRAIDEHGFVNRLINFILLNEKIFLQYINNSTTNSGSML